MKRDVRKLLGRLHPVVQQIRDQETSGGSGEPRISPQDIAAAVGMLPHRQETRIFLAINWPDSVSIPDLCHELCEDLFQKWSSLEIAHQREFVKRISNRSPLDIASVRWKYDPRLYKRIPAVCLLEASTGSVCSLCFGDQEDCPLCGGTGHLPMTQTKRAELLSTSRRTLARDFTQPYVWLLHRVCKAEQLAARTLARLLA